MTVSSFFVYAGDVVGTKVAEMYSSPQPLSLSSNLSPKLSSQKTKVSDPSICVSGLSYIVLGWSSILSPKVSSLS